MIATIAKEWERVKGRAIKGKRRIKKAHPCDARVIKGQRLAAIAMMLSVNREGPQLLRFNRRMRK